ncbi:transglycosylase SLT domain-containing protein [Acidithiobacillus acidisediminis]|uniref:lytic transglycosylase domain-containing protein n=1 Tax=Acidithiobacillus acidisediminis TaxID=2937799 RepID=UPI00200FCFBE|nr:transglycosylase SLT domain-containing protein [Acidithiobacillus sp. S30A2]
MLACLNEAATAYHVPVSAIERVMTAAGRAKSGVGPMGIPQQWLPVLTAYGFSASAVRKSPCWGIAAGTWILAVEKLYADGGRGISARGHFVYPTALPAIPSRFVRWANQASAATGVPAAMILAVAAQESGFHPDAVSDKGAQGLMQFMPGTWVRFGQGSPFDPRDAIFAGARYLRHLELRLKSWPLAVAGYNAGGQAVVDAGYRIPPFRQTQQYVPAVISRFEQYSHKGVQ